MPETQPNSTAVSTSDQGVSQIPQPSNQNADPPLVKKRNSLKTILIIFLILVLWIIFSFISYFFLCMFPDSLCGRLILGLNPQSEAGWILVFGLFFIPPIVVLIGTITTCVIYFRTSRRLNLIFLVFITLLL